MSILSWDRFLYILTRRHFPIMRLAQTYSQRVILVNDVDHYCRLGTLPYTGTVRVDAKSDRNGAIILPPCCLEDSLQRFAGGRC